MTKAAGRSSLANRIAPPRFILFAVTVIAAAIPGTMFFGWQQGGLVGFDIGAAIFLISLSPLLRDCGAAEMMRQSAENDANRALLLGLAASVMLIILVAIALELAEKNNPPPAEIVLIVATLILSWAFTNSIFALHYAHMYYMPDPESARYAGGMSFQKPPNPITGTSSISPSAWG